ncbi:hypothetical protein PFICI_01840 [Pestalotiopsis fici W106-1]|uniref:WSC domain-containing protein n=1 Tax=Pestalotiopsis fici (strain W106-1 / CGMCC3.15140) TaxID=1229662 RepID=W3XR69_PESFW|nr:uncharacterized protein PFICI_01840 [Pestalotiopsis fici W106-1]ETS88012.1 hypothetical protein PFICI_01840 [Pestalotiopsis fici W106-1]
MVRLGLKGSRLPSLVLACLLAVLAHAQGTNETSELQIYNSSTTYHYVGCWNETTGIAQSTGARALPDISLAQPDTMTVEICLDFCANNQSTPYNYAGLEYSRECWCANKLSRLSVQLADAECNTPCDGNQTDACGGALKLSLYNITTADTKSGSPAIRMETANMAFLALALTVTAALF